MLDTLTDNNGKFIFPNLEFADNTKFVVQSRVEKGQDDVTLYLDTPSFPAISMKNKGINNAPSFKKVDTTYYMVNQRRFYEEQQKYGINKHAIVLKDVIIKGKKDFLKNSQNLNGSGAADQVVTADDLRNSVGATLSFRLTEKLASTVKFVNGVPYRRSPPSSTPLQVVIDGNYADFNEYDHLDPDRIQSIEVLTSFNFYTVYGTRGAAGLLIITTKRGADYNHNYRYAPGVVTYMPKGFYKAREFYSPQYDNPKTNQKMLDLRSTIYWNPNVITDKDGKASFSYFNADGKGTYRVVVEGIDAEGNLGRQVYRYKVD